MLTPPRKCHLLTILKAIQYTTNRGGEDGQEDLAAVDDDLSGYDDDFVGSGAESDGDSDEAPGIVTPPGELGEQDSRGKKKVKASQGTTPGKRSSKNPRQAPMPKKAATPKTPSTKKTSAPTPNKSVTASRKTPISKNSETAKQPSTGKRRSVGKYADLKRAIKPKKAAGSRSKGKTVTEATSIDAMNPQTLPEPTPPPSDPMATSPSASTDVPTVPPLPASLPSRPQFVEHLPPAVSWDTPGTAFPPPQASTHSAAPSGEATGSLPPGPASLPARPPTPLEQRPSMHSFRPGAQPDLMLSNFTNTYLPNDGQNNFTGSLPTYLANNVPNSLHTSNSTPTGFPSTMYQQPDPWHPQSPLLSAMPPMQANTTLPLMGLDQATAAYQVPQAYQEAPGPQPAPGQSANPQWQLQEDQFYTWGPLFR